MRVGCRFTQCGMNWLKADIMLVYAQSVDFIKLNKSLLAFLIEGLGDLR